MKIFKPKRVWCDLCGFYIANTQFKKHKNSCFGRGPLRLRVGRGQDWMRGKTYDELFGKEKADLKRQYLSVSLKNKPLVIKDEQSRRDKISLKMKGNTNWLHSIHVSGKGRKGRFDGEYFASSWELAFMVYCRDMKIPIKRNWSKFLYYDANGNHGRYIPDFLMHDGSYVEVKGYVRDDVFYKKKHFPHKLVIYEKHKMRPILNYVINTYGRNFVDFLKDKVTERLGSKLQIC